MKNTDNMKFIMMESETFNELVEQISNKIIQAVHPQKKWLYKEEAKTMLNIRSNTTLAKLSNEGKIIISQFGRKILYNTDSIKQFLEKNKM